MRISPLEFSLDFGISTNKNPLKTKEERQGFDSLQLHFSGIHLNSNQSKIPANLIVCRDFCIFAPTGQFKQIQISSTTNRTPIVEKHRSVRITKK